MTEQSQILHNIRILDFSWVLAGPYATRLLADFGAEVIKVQPLIPSGADDAFARGYYNNWNRNKVGITLNLDKPEGVDLAKRLVKISDAVVENFSPRVMTNFGLDYENLKKVKPDIIMLSMSVMGQTGPQRDYVGFGPTVQALSGMTQLTSFPGQPPTGLGFSYADHVAGLYTSLSLLGALEHRYKTGDGQHIDISQVEATASLLGGAIMDYSATGQQPMPSGNSSPLAAPHNVYPCKDDRWCAITVFTEDDWLGFRRALGNPSWAEDAKFATLTVRVCNSGELDKRITTWTREKEAYDVMTVLQSNGVAAGVVQDARDLVNDPQLKSRGFFVKLKENLTDGMPLKMSGASAGYRCEAPAPGYDNSYVYQELLGISNKELDGLRDRGVI
jgi:benzylsuccinate CoA-transferase BbsF subunit